MLPIVSFPAHDPSVAREFGYQLCARTLGRTLLTTPAAWLLVSWMCWAAVPHGRVLGWLSYAVIARALELAILRRLLSGDRVIARGKAWLLVVAALDGYDANPMGRVLQRRPRPPAASWWCKP